MRIGAGEAIAKARFANADVMDYETPLTSLVWLTSLVSVALTFLPEDLERKLWGPTVPVVKLVRAFGGCLGTKRR